MNRYKYLFLPVLFLLLSYSGFSQDLSIPLISKSGLENHITFLASDSLQGRGFTSKIPALEITADYLVAAIE
ncbi:MAG: hypothetical protein LC658_03480, partial [Bacteroidales bacterium]|nr:hypothetical protein [Bacteroidales bacterium]